MKANPDSTTAFQLGLTGWPLGHSLSPLLHNAALKALGLNGEYRLYPVEAPNALAELLDDIRQGGLHGLNVTIPHKQAVLPLLDELTPTARAIGAVNTIYCREGRLIGENTDAAGFLADLRRLSMPKSAPARSHALVLGAGGSAHAVVYALAQSGWQVTIAARRLEQAQRLAQDLQTDSQSIQAARLGNEMYTLAVDLIVNTTPLGMTPNVQASIWPADMPFPARAAVYDLVYNPLQTALVTAASAQGLQAISGLGMLVEQAALAFEIWTRHDTPREAMWKAVQPAEEAS